MQDEICTKFAVLSKLPCLSRLVFIDNFMKAAHVNPTNKNKFGPQGATLRGFLGTTPIDVIKRNVGIFEPYFYGDF